MKTKKEKFVLAVSLLVLFTFTNDSFCQLKNLGIKGGLNVSDATIGHTFYTPDANEPRTGFNVSLFYDFLNFKNLSVSSEASYSQRGFKNEFIVTNEFGEETGSGTINNLLNYIDFSAIAKLIIRNNSVSPYASAGPVVAFNTGYSTKISGDNVASVSSIENELFEEMKKTSLGIKAGVGAEFNRIIPQTIILEGRFYTDLTNIYKSEFLEFKRNQVWEVNLGIKF